MISLAIPTGVVALVQGVGAMPLPFNLHVVDARLPGIFKLHMLASGAALVLMPAVIATRRWRSWHRPLGRLTAILVVAGALTAFPVAYASVSGPVARLGFAAQGATWLGLIVWGVVAIRRKERARHATLMLAMAAVASGAIWVRLTTAVATSWGLPFDPIYACATWLGWLVPLGLVLALSPVSILSGRRPPRTAFAT
ncbi:DUF2306 domain-containing protein [Hyphomicrobium sp.]|uniref:DUF2306 domain-containing protein n=1 Tax=Hyphomicrobium sp. TaxID=82 RepID=UPI0025BA6A43|nr:DUF2306 domain-containing protein [Hyphomicrobium sp.]